MAKQNVTFIERHVEKFVVGAAAVILLGVIALYGISTPNTVEVGGEALGPSDFYAQLKERAETALTGMRSRSKLDDAQPIPQLAVAMGQGPHSGAKLPLDYMAGGYAPHPVVPTTGLDDNRGDIVLAEVLPPKAVTVRDGRAPVALPRQQILQAGVQQQSQSGGQLAPIPSDYHWALVAAALDRKAQSEVFAKAGYDENRRQLIVAEVQAERRQLGPDGRWSAPVQIRGYSESVIVGPSTIEPELVDGVPVFPDAARSYVEAYRNQLYSVESQSQILRPPFQYLLEPKYQLAWAPPRTLPGYDFKLSEFGVIFPVESDGRPGVRPPGRVQPGRLGGPAPRGLDAGPTPPAGQARGAFDPQARRRARELSEQAEAAIKNEDYLKAGELLSAIIADTAVPERDREAAQKRLESIEPDLLRVQNELARQAQRRQALGITKLGEDVEPIWLTDITVKPGETYQYRLRVVAFNEYAGRVGLLRSAEDAGRVLIEGQWSDWSEPITVTPSVRMFFTDAPDGGNKARITVSQWIRGEWKENYGELSIGDPVSFTSGRDTFAYDGIIVGLENGRQYRPRDRQGLGAPETTHVLTLVSASGQVEERLSKEDSLKLREHRNWVREEERRLASEREQAINPVRGSNFPAGLPNNFGAPGGFESDPGSRGGRFRRGS